MQAQRKTFRTIDASDFLLPEPRRRGRLEPAAANGQIEDAVFEVIRPVPRYGARLNDNPSRRETRPAELLPLTTRLAVRFIALVERQLLKLSAPAFSTLLVSVFFIVFWFFGGFGALSNAKMLPAPAAPFTIERTFFATEDANGMKILAVSGTITNVSALTHRPPVLRVVGSDGKVEFGRIVVSDKAVGPSQSLRFSGRFKLDGGKSGDIAIIPDAR